MSAKRRAVEQWAQGSTYRGPADNVFLVAGDGVLSAREAAVERTLGFIFSEKTCASERKGT
jgi:hypothetical protein